MRNPRRGEVEGLTAETGTVVPRAAAPSLAVAALEVYSTSNAWAA